MSAQAEKETAAEAAAALVAEAAGRTAGEFVLGLGTGSTAALFVRALALRGVKLTCVSTSAATASLAQGLGMRLLEVDSVDHIDLVVDGADEIAPDLTLIKGGGGALLREKLVWEGAARRVVIADAGKRVERLGAFPLPVEIVPFAAAATRDRVRKRLAAFGVSSAPRLRRSGGEPFVTDEGNLIIDVTCGEIPDPRGLGAALKMTTGVVEHGLFLDLADEALIAVGADLVTRRRGAGLPTWTAKAREGTDTA